MANAVTAEEQPTNRNNNTTSRCSTVASHVDYQLECRGFEYDS
jgi:hypothetical protein